MRDFPVGGCYLLRLFFFFTEIPERASHQGLDALSLSVAGSFRRSGRQGGEAGRAKKMVGEKNTGKR